MSFRVGHEVSPVLAAPIELEEAVQRHYAQGGGQGAVAATRPEVQQVPELLMFELNHPGRPPDFKAAVQLSGWIAEYNCGARPIDDGYPRTIHAQESHESQESQESSGRPPASHAADDATAAPGAAQEVAPLGSARPLR